MHRVMARVRGFYAKTIRHARSACQNAGPRIPEKISLGTKNESLLYCPEPEVRYILFVGPRFGSLLKSPLSLSFRRSEAKTNLLFPGHLWLPRCCSGFSACVLFERARRTCYFSVSALPGWRNGRR